MNASNGKTETCQKEVSSKMLTSSLPTTTGSNSDCLADIIFTVDFAAQKHKNQRRKDPAKTPYINHPIGKFLNTSRPAQFDL